MYGKQIQYQTEQAIYSSVFCGHSNMTLSSSFNHICKQAILLAKAN